MASLRHLLDEGHNFRRLVEFAVDEALAVDFAVALDGALDFVDELSGVEFGDDDVLDVLRERGERLP